MGTCWFAFGSNTDCHSVPHLSRTSSPSITVSLTHYYIQRWKKIGTIPVDMIVLPVIYQYAQWLTTGVNSVILTTIFAGLVSQVWLRRYHPAWFRKYIYILGGAIDGGTQIMVFILSFAVFGASGVSRPFPNVSESGFI